MARVRQLGSLCTAVGRATVPRYVCGAGVVLVWVMCCCVVVWLCVCCASWGGGMLCLEAGLDVAFLFFFFFFFVAHVVGLFVAPLTQRPSSHPPFSPPPSSPTCAITTSTTTIHPWNTGRPSSWPVRPCVSLHSRGSTHTRGSWQCLARQALPHHQKTSQRRSFVVHPSG